MGLLYLDSTGNFSEPIKTDLLYLDAEHRWTRPGGGRSLRYFDADGAWTVPVIGTPAGELPVGTPGNDTLVEFMRFYDEPIIWRVIGKDLPGMPENSVTLFMDKIIMLGCFVNFDQATAENSGVPTDVWSKSDIREWANSTKAAGEWWTYKFRHNYPPGNVDGYPSYAYSNVEYINKDGLLHNATEQERQSIIKTTRKYFGFDSGKAVQQTSADSLFLLEGYELGAEASYYYTASQTYQRYRIPYFASNQSRQATCTAKCLDLANYSGADTSTGFSYYTCTSLTNAGYTSSFYVCRVLMVSKTGDVNGDKDQYGRWSGVWEGAKDNPNAGIRLACNVSRDALLVPVTD